MMSLRNHPNLIQLLGICTSPFSVVLEFAANGALDELLYGARAARFNPTDALLRHIVLGIADGVAHLHHENVIHRDLAARNVLLTEAFDAKITDFGMSREAAADGERQTTKTNIGPIRWMYVTRAFSIV